MEGRGIVRDRRKCSRIISFLSSPPSYDMFQVEVCLYYGGQALSKHAYSPPAKLTRNFFTSVVWDKW